MDRPLKKELIFTVFCVMIALCMVPKKAQAGDLQIAVQDYIAICNNGAMDTCNSEIGKNINADVLMVSSEAGYPSCVPDDRLDSFDTIVGSAVLGWLEQHPELGNEVMENAINSAEDALYPCLTPK
jgi:hypothetical protein